MPSLHDEYQTVQTDADRTLNAMEELAKKGEGLSEDDRKTLSAHGETSKKQFARLDELKGLIDARKRFAGHRLEEGTATPPAKIPGQQEVEEDRKQMSSKDRAYEAVKWFAATGNFDERRFATITTTTGGGIILPSSILPPLAAIQENVLIRSIAEFGMKPLETPGTDVLKIPVPDINAGGAISESATNGTDGTQVFSGSFNLTPVPIASDQLWFSNGSLAAPGYDLLSSMLPVMQYGQNLGEEKTDLTAMKADTNIATGATTPTGASGLTLTYANLLAWIEAVPTNWQAAGQFGVMSPSAYALALGLTSDVANKLITVDNAGLMRIKGCAVRKTAYLDAMGLSHVVGLTFSSRSLMIRNGTQYRLNRYTNSARRDQIGFEVVRDHVTGYAAIGVASLKTPGT